MRLTLIGRDHQKNTVFGYSELLEKTGPSFSNRALFDPGPTGSADSVQLLERSRPGFGFH